MAQFIISGKMILSAHEIESFEDLIEDFNEGSGAYSVVLERTSVRSRRRKKAEKPKTISVPRVFLLDIRKCYAKMLINVMNSQDFPLLYGFIDTYFAPDAKHISVKYAGKGELRKKYCLQISGSEEIAKFWYSFMSLSPDSITTLVNSTIQHTTGNVVSLMHKDGTQIFELRDRFGSCDYVEYILINQHGHERANFGAGDNAKIDGSKKRKCEEPIDLSDKIRRMRGIMSAVESAVGRLVLRQTPVSVPSDGTIIISTDCNKRITQIEAVVEY